MNRTAIAVFFGLLLGLILACGTAHAVNGTARSLGGDEWAFYTASNSSNRTTSFLYTDLLARNHFIGMNCSVWNSSGSPSGLGSWNMTLYGSHDGLAFYSLGTYDVGTLNNATHHWNASNIPFKGFKIVPGHINNNATYEYFYRGKR